MSDVKNRLIYILTVCQDLSLENALSIENHLKMGNVLNAIQLVASNVVFAGLSVSTCVHGGPSRGLICQESYLFEVLTVLLLYLALLSNVLNVLVSLHLLRVIGVEELNLIGGV